MLTFTLHAISVLNVVQDSCLHYCQPSWLSSTYISSPYSGNESLQSHCHRWKPVIESWSKTGLNITHKDYLVNGGMVPDCWTVCFFRCVIKVSKALSGFSHLSNWLKSGKGIPVSSMCVLLMYGLHEVMWWASYQERCVISINFLKLPLQ
jgi:hypothetical protein